jgi:hypothetical protein
MDELRPHRCGQWLVARVALNHGDLPRSACRRSPFGRVADVHLRKMALWRL